MAQTSTPPQRLTRSDWQQWIDGLDAFLFDCDGVLWVGETPIKGAKELIALLRSLGKRVVFVTNNATKTRDAYVKKLASHGIEAVEDDIVTSAWATVQYMKSQKIEGKVYVVGEQGLVTELEKEGYEPYGLEHNDIKGLPTPLTVDPSTKAVVVGLDRYVSYYKLAYATVCIRQIPGCRFIGTNPDQTFPIDGAIIPGGGSMIGLIECATSHPPEAYVGKPSQALLDTIVSTFKLDRSRTCMVGDRLNTDMQFGKLGGLQTLLVLSGVTHEEQLASIDKPEHVPHHFVDSVDVLNELHLLTRN